MQFRAIAAGPAGPVRRGGKVARNSLALEQSSRAVMASRFSAIPLRKRLIFEFQHGRETWRSWRMALTSEDQGTAGNDAASKTRK
jgi:hypothetical protein